MLTREGTPYSSGALDLCIAPVYLSPYQCRALYMRSLAVFLRKKFEYDFGHDQVRERQEAIRQHGTTGYRLCTETLGPRIDASLSVRNACCRNAFRLVSGAISVTCLFRLLGSVRRKPKRVRYTYAYSKMYGSLAILQRTISPTYSYLVHLLEIERCQFRLAPSYIPPRRKGLARSRSNGKAF
jgi:hypothetical protein